jgi:hypothetical protein
MKCWGPTHWRRGCGGCPMRPMPTPRRPRCWRWRRLIQRRACARGLCERAADVLRRVPAAAKAAGEWCWAEGGAVALTAYYERLLLATARATAVVGWVDVVQELIHDITSAGGPPAEVIKPAVGAVAGPLFRALHRHQLVPEAEALIHAVSPNDIPADVSFAIGYAAAGQPALTARLLDTARQEVFRHVQDLRTQSRLAIRYADALAALPPRKALGRLEELFQRLDEVDTVGSTNRYFTLPVLELVDAVVRAAAGDDPTSPAVHDWLVALARDTRTRMARDLASVVLRWVPVPRGTV